MRQLLPTITSKRIDSQNTGGTVYLGVHLNGWTPEDVQATYGESLEKIVELYKIHRPCWTITDFRYPARDETIVAKGNSFTFNPYTLGRDEAEYWTYVKQPIIHVRGREGPRLILKKATENN